MGIVINRDARRVVLTCPSSKSVTVSSSSGTELNVTTNVQRVDVHTPDVPGRTTAMMRAPTTLAVAYGGASGDKSFIHQQLTPSDTWLIVHNLNKYPSVTVVNSAGECVLGKVEYLDENRVVAYFKGAFGGDAYLN